MSSEIVFLALFLGGVALVAVGFSVSYYLNQQRISAYQLFCANSGYQFVTDRMGAQTDYVAIVPFFDKGYSRRWRYEISGQYNATAFTAFQYDYTVSSGRSSTTYRHAMVRWTSPTPLPQFTLGPETLFSRLGEALGWHDINFGDDPAFSSAYVLKGEHEMDVASLFSPDVRQQLLAVPGQHAAGAGSVLFWWRDGRLPGPEAFGPFLTSGDQVRAILLRS